jgi:hypothetical protein
MSAIASARKTTSRTSKSLFRTLKKVVVRTLIVFGAIYVINVAYVSILMFRQS